MVEQNQRCKNACFIKALAAGHPHQHRCSINKLPLHLHRGSSCLFDGGAHVVEAYTRIRRDLSLQRYHSSSANAHQDERCDGCKDYWESLARQSIFLQGSHFS